VKRIILTLILILVSATSVFAAKIPDDVKGVIRKDFPRADFRFDGLVTLPDGTLYLPLYPALVKKPDALVLKSTYPEGKTIADKPDIIILNNDFSFLKVITDKKNRRTVINLPNPPVEVRTGLLPQDLLVPSGLIIPDNIKGIIGNLQIDTAKDAGLKVKTDLVLQQRTTNEVFKKGQKNISLIPQLKNKVMYIATCYSKNVQVVEGEANSPAYALEQKSIPIDIEITNDDKLLLVTTFGKTFVDVISLADERSIKQIDLTTQAEEIVIDRAANKAYVSSGEDSSIYIIDLNTMTLKQKIKVKGMCQKLYLTDDGKKLFYFNKKNNDVWVIELDNDFVIKNMGNFPNVSKITFAQNKVYITSRTKNRLAIVDYVTLALLKELEIQQKPIDMLVYKNDLFILSAQNNVLQILDTINDEITGTINLNTQGFSTEIYRIKNSPVALVMDTKVGKYSIIDLDKKSLIKTNLLNIPVSTVIVAEKVRKIGK